MTIVLGKSAEIQVCMAVLSDSDQKKKKTVSLALLKET